MNAITYSGLYCKSMQSWTHSQCEKTLTDNADFNCLQRPIIAFAFRPQNKYRCTVFLSISASTSDSQSSQNFFVQCARHRDGKLEEKKKQCQRRFDFCLSTAMRGSTKFTCERDIDALLKHSAFRSHGWRQVHPLLSTNKARYAKTRKKLKKKWQRALCNASAILRAHSTQPKRMSSQSFTVHFTFNEAIVLLCTTIFQCTLLQSRFVHLMLLLLFARRHSSVPVFKAHQRRTSFPF